MQLQKTLWNEPPAALKDSSGMSFLYPRIISIFREQTQLVAGNAGYLGHRRATEVLQLSNIQASLQSPSIGTRRSGEGSLPDDAVGPVRWNIFVPAGAIVKGTVLSRDIIVDDEGNRYQVASAYWTPLGWKIQTIRLEA